MHGTGQVKVRVRLPLEVPGQVQCRQRRRGLARYFDSQVARHEGATTIRAKSQYHLMKGSQAAARRLALRRVQIII